jgi:alkyl hydroperoxide reductase subunit AhpC
MFRTLARNTNVTHAVDDSYYKGGLQFFVLTFMDTSFSFVTVTSLIDTSLHVTDVSEVSAPN